MPTGDGSFHLSVTVSGALHLRALPVSETISTVTVVTSHLFFCSFLFPEEARRHGSPGEAERSLPPVPAVDLRADLQVKVEREEESDTPRARAAAALKRQEAGEENKKARGEPFRI